MVRGIFFDRAGNQIDVHQWRALVTSADYTRVATANVGTTTVRTVWLGLDPDDSHAVFATLVCDQAGAQTVRRYHTELSALDGHAEVCFELSAVIGNVVHHYSVEGEPGTGSTHKSLEEAIARAQAIGNADVWSVRYSVNARGQTGVDRRKVYPAEAG